MFGHVRKHTPTARGNDRFSWAPDALVFLGILGLSALGCGGPTAPTAPFDAGVGPDLVRGARLADAREPLPARADAIALAQSIEASAGKEGSGARAVELHTVAARLLERVWRTEGLEQDAKEALLLYGAAAQNPSLAGACDAALAGARLAGEVARDASISYAELYRAERRFAAAAARGANDAACLTGFAQGLALLAPFRPPARVLEAIDEGLAGEGEIAKAAAANVPVRGAAPRVVRIDEWGGETAARVVVTLDRPARYRVVDDAAGGHTPRTFVELDGVDLGAEARESATGGIVTRVRAQGTSTGTRVAIDLGGRAYRKVFPLLEPYRIVIDIAKTPPGAHRAGERPVARVVLDPGHGGGDPGAMGQSGLKEKDVTLDVAHRVAPVLAQRGIVVLLTRDDDRNVTLEERTARANGFGADLFVSIHCNASEGRGRHGVETYVLDVTRDEIASRVAARENATSAAATAELGSILASMRLSDQSARSTKLAELLQKATMASLAPAFADVLDGGVHTAGFYVLVGARMPGVLFETSYISNVAEEERLGNADYKQRLADGIVNAVLAYREGR
jgi:N-acetylmuramoyl-L-alanine amidase